MPASAPARIAESNSPARGPSTPNCAIDSDQSSTRTSSLKMNISHLPRTAAADRRLEIDEERVAELEHAHVGNHPPLRGQIGGIAARFLP